MSGPPQRISQFPVPVVRGHFATFCYNFTGSGITSTTLEVNFNPSSGSKGYPVSVASPCITVFIPEDKLTCIISDDSGVSPDFAATLAG